MFLIFRNYPLLLIYSFIVFVLIFGVYQDSGFVYLPSIFAYFGMFLLTFLALNHFINKDKVFLMFESGKLSLNIDKLFKYFAVFSGVFTILHYYQMGQIPIITALIIEDYDAIVHLRTNVFLNAHPFFVYGSSFLLKAIMPFLVLYFYMTKQKSWLIPIIIIFAFYSVSLIAKSYVLTLFLPVTVYSFLNKKFLDSIIFSAIFIGGIYFLIYATNPQLQPDNADFKKEVKEDHNDSEIFDLDEGMSDMIAPANSLIYTRIILVPGKMVSDWFRVIPNEKPFLNGAGYRFIAPFIGTEFVEYSKELYAVFYPHFAEKGFEGTVNVASFMYEYANFGFIGLLLSGLILALIIFFVELLYKNDLSLKISLNTFYILMLSSSALSTIIFSGGWFMVVFLFILYKIGQNKNQISIAQPIVQA
jgi:hypothetical protein